MRTPERGPETMNLRTWAQVLIAASFSILGLVEALARTSHTTSTAVRDGHMSTSLRSSDVLDVLSSTPAGVACRAPRIHGPLTRLVTILCEKSGLRRRAAAEDGRTPSEAESNR